MKFVIFKEAFINNSKMTILVNDDEGMPMEFESLETAERIAKLFETNSHIGSKYRVKQIS